MLASRCEVSWIAIGMELYEKRKGEGGKKRKKGEEGRALVKGSQSNPVSRL